MYTTNLRKVGGSVMLAIPPALLDLLDLRPGANVAVAVEDGRLVVAGRRRRYTLDELIAQSNPRARRRREDRNWLRSKPVGRELI